MNGSRRIGWVAGGLFGVALMVSCSLYRNDRAWLPDEQYTLARTMYLQTGSLDLVERQLKDLQWRRARINEAIYRLQKEFEVLPEEVPAAEVQATVTTATLPIMVAPMATVTTATAANATTATTATAVRATTATSSTLMLPPPPPAK